MDNIKSDTLINGFKVCSLPPWNPNEIDYSKCLGKNQKKSSDRSNSTITLNFVDVCSSELVDKCINIENVVLHENRPLVFYTWYKVWELFATRSSSATEGKIESSREISNLEKKSLATSEDISNTQHFLSAPSENAFSTQHLAKGLSEDVENIFNSFTSRQVNRSNKIAYDSCRFNSKRRLDFEQGHDQTYATPSKRSVQLPITNIS